MITGFNPTDMFAADHIRRVLLPFPGVFSGIGEFSVHKVFVSSKVAGHTARLLNPALGRILEAAAVGLVAVIHCGILRQSTVRSPERVTPFESVVECPEQLTDQPEVARLCAAAEAAESRQ